MRLWKDEHGGAVSEYSLLLAFLILVSACLFLANASNVSGVWEAANSFISRGSGSQSQGTTSVIP